MIQIATEKQCRKVIARNDLTHVEEIARFLPVGRRGEFNGMQVRWANYAWQGEGCDEVAQVSPLVHSLRGKSRFNDARTRNKGMLLTLPPFNFAQIDTSQELSGQSLRNWNTTSTHTILGAILHRTQIQMSRESPMKSPSRLLVDCP